MFLIACQSTNNQSAPTTIASTLTSTSTIPVNSPSPSPSLISSFTPTQKLLPTITPPPLRQPPLVLPEGLEIEEYVWDESLSFDEIRRRHNGEMEKPYTSSYPYQPPFFYGTGDRTHAVNVVLDNSIVVSTQRLDGEKWSVIVTESGNNIFETKVAEISGVNGLLEIWGYGEHWALVIIPYPINDVNPPVDVIFDGKSLSKNHNYIEAFGFQFLDGKPFYFFKTEEGIGISYDNIDTQLNYDEVPWHNRWVGYDYNPIPYKNLVEFFGTREQTTYWVVVGVFQK